VQPKHFQRLCVKFFVHLMAAEELRLKDARARMGTFSVRSGISMKELEEYMAKFIMMMNDHYVTGHSIPTEVMDPRFLEVTQELLLFNLAERGIQFKSFGSTIGKWRSHFKLNPEQSAEFSRMLVAELTNTYVRAKSA
jgi:hypothetical protein